MMHDLEQQNATCSLIRRLDQIRMSESERWAAVVYMRRGKRIADCILTLARFLRGISTAGAALATNGYRGVLRKLAVSRARTRARARTT